MIRKNLGFAAYTATGVGFLSLSFIRNMDLISYTIIFFCTVFYIIGLYKHYKELKNS